MIKFKLNVRKFYFNTRCVVLMSSNCARGVEGLSDDKSKSVLSFDDIPGPKSYPFIGTLYKYLPVIGDYNAESLDKNASLNWRRYGSLVRENPGVRLLHVFDPDDIEAVFRQDDRYPARRSHLAMQHYRLNKKHVYNTGGLLSTNGPEWWKLRSTFQKNFTSPQSVKEHVLSTDGVVRDFVQWIKDSNLTSDTDYLTYLNRLNLEARVLTGHCKLNKHLHTMGLSDITNCRFCGTEDETPMHILCSCMALHNKRSQHLGGHTTTAKLVQETPPRNIVNFNVDCGLVIGLVAFNERFNSFSPSEQDLESRSSKTIEAAFGSNRGIMKLDKGFLWRLFKTPLYRSLAASQEYLEKVSSEILLKRVHFFETENDDTDKSLLASFIQQPNLDLKDITGMMVDILMASVDTTAYSTAFALYHLSRNPSCQEKLHKEALTILPTKDTILTADMLSQATYVRCCIKETLRLNPISIGVGRLLQKDIILKGYLIPKETVIVTQNMLASRLPQYVKDPLQFKPERWLRGSPDYENIHPFLSLPFGFGPRTCIARRLAEQNITITLLRLFREFDVKWDGGDLGIRTLLINRPDQPILLSLTPRSS